ncbi:MAG: zinc-dependent metalloprotease [Acidobacteriota bacterium]
MRILCLLSAVILLVSVPAFAEEGKTPTIAEVSQAAESHDGLFRLHQNEARGKIWLELPAPDGEGLVASVLYVDGLTTGLGSNPVGLDRGQLGRQRVLDIHRFGPKVLFLERNLGFRALSEDPLERRATAQSFAPSVEWAGEVAALEEDGRSLVEISSFLIRDAHAVLQTLRDTDQGAYRLDSERSAVDFTASLAFPDNLEFEAFLTYALEAPEPGRLVARTAPGPESFGLVQHHSLIRLPDDGYRPRPGDPRIGFFGPQFQDYAVGLDASIHRWFISRHRLEKTDPEAERSTVKEPIVYYVDSGAPEPIQSALIEGAMWWAEAFEEAGFIDAYRVEVMPADAHPLDVRYNVIQWVHRSTRGWSYGGGVIDPRTGEILKGHVSLGSLRVRQDRLLFEGLLGTAKTGTGDPDDPIELALARIRQLSAHEVGHTLGITHNFAASTYAGRASVMDYPAPLVTVRDGALDVSQAYGVGLGAWDIHTVRYGYSQFPSSVDERAALEAIVQDGLRDGLLFITDADARPAGASDPRGNLWDNGADAVDALETTLAVRRHALDRFGADRLPEGLPLAQLEEVLVPVYFHHRFQVQAAAKVIGGLEFDYAVRGDGQPPPRWVTPERQRRALDVMMGLLEPSFLDLPDEVLALMTPRAFGSERNREMFRSQTRPAFDALGAAESAADQVIQQLLQPHRLSRILEAERRLEGALSLRDLLDQLEEPVTAPTSGTAREQSLRDVVQRVIVERMMALAADESAPLRLRLRIEDRLTAWRDVLATRDGGQGAALARRLGRFFDHGLEYKPDAAAQPMPPGSPIGSDDPGFHAVGGMHSGHNAGGGCSFEATR